MNTISNMDASTRRRNGRFCRSRAGILLAALISTVATNAHADESSQVGRVSSLTVFGSDPCPPGNDGEIVVCAREPEAERYRIPKELRRVKYQPPEQSWTSRVHTLEDMARVGLPNSCSAVGTGGQTGCYAHALERWFADRR